jgi:hypothetical protein
MRREIAFMKNPPFEYEAEADDALILTGRFYRRFSLDAALRTV